MQTKKQKMISRFLKYAVWTSIFCFYAISAAQAKTWLVGPDFRLHKPSEAIKLAKSGDIIKIVAGLYENDYAIINQDNLTIEGLNGFAHLKSSGPVPGGKAIWVTNGKNITIRNIEFSGARVPDKNGAGIRLQRGSLIIENSYFHDNQMGILTNAGRDITLTIKYSEFSRNILLTPQTRNPAHNIYIGSIAEFIMENSISRGAQYGHTVKSRARKTILRNNRIFDEGEISASYLVDIPNGGNIIIENNYIYKNKGAQNTAVISYGAEGMKYEDNSITVKYNTIINEEGMAFLLRNHSSIKAVMARNETKNISVDEIPGMERRGFWEKLKNKLRKYFNK